MGLEILIRPTRAIVAAGEQPCRLWLGKLPDGTELVLAVALVGAAVTLHTPELDRQLERLQAPNVGRKTTELIGLTELAMLRMALDPTMQEV